MRRVSREFCCGSAVAGVSWRAAGLRERRGVARVRGMISGQIN